MFSHIFKKIKNHKLAFIIFIIFFLIPFFWLEPGEMDLGGDANRLYFYDPINFLKSTALYVFAREGKGTIDPRYFYFPYVFFIFLMKLILQSPTFVIALLNSFKLAIGFVSIYLIIRELLCISYKKRIDTKKASLIGGVFYVISFASFHMSFFWDRALFTHDQIFLNPLIFYLLLKFVVTNKYIYLSCLLFISFIFSTNFSLLGSAPPFFSFYPISIVFLLSYLKYFSTKKIHWKNIFVGILLYLGVHGFHLLGEVISIFDLGSAGNTIIFSKHGIENEGIRYFSAVHHYGQTVINILLPSQNKIFSAFSLIYFLVVLCGLLVSKKKALFYIAIFFIIIFFLATANITHIGVEFYKTLFYIPGISMFRNFYTQWMYIFIFFYSLMIGFSIFEIVSILKEKYKKMFFFSILTILIFTGFPLFSGNFVNNQIVRGSKNLRTVTKMDLKYVETIDYIRKLPDGKILILPLTDSFRQVLSGKNGGVYEGPSTLLDLTYKYSFTGYQHFGYLGNSAYAEQVLKFSKEKNYNNLLYIFSLLNIRYILHNSDPNIYEDGFFNGSYTYVFSYLPKTQKEYIEYLKHFPLKKIYNKGTYAIYKFDNAFYNPLIFVPENIYKSDKLSFNKKSFKSIFVDNNTCNKNHLTKDICNNYKYENIDVEFKEVNPTNFKVKINSKNFSPTILVLQTPFHNAWKLIHNNKLYGQHVLVNGYANGWVLSSDEVSQLEKKDIVINLDHQKYFWYGWYITIVSLITIAIIAIVSAIRYGKN